MYPESGGGAPEPMPSGGSFGDEGIVSRLTQNFEGLIPLLLILIIILFIGTRAGFIDLPIPGLNDKKPLRTLIVGEPSVDFISLLSQDKDMTVFRLRDPGSLTVAPSSYLAKYDLVILDQTNSPDKRVSRQLGEAIVDYVRTGGKLVTVLDSGILRSGGITGEGRAADVVGWEATFDNIVPVKCDRTIGDVPSCTQQIQVVGRIWAEDLEHPIMEGIEVAPAHPADPPYLLLTFNVMPSGNQIAFIKDQQTTSYYPAIVENKLIIGKSLYFNYDPALTPGIWQNTLEYLRGK